MSVASAQTSRTRATPNLLFAGLAIIVALAAFHNGLRELVHRWSTQEEYSHGFLIPLVSAWLLWNRREAIAANVGRPNWTGLVLIIPAIAMQIVGELSAIYIFSQLAFVLVLLGIMLATGGYPLLRVTFIPVVFLLFAIPLPYFVDSVLTLQLQLVSSQLGAAFISLFQIPVYLDGNVIDLGTYKLEVAEACSGLRYLYPLLSLSFLAAYLFQAPVWQRAVVFLSAIPITILMNSFRIGMVGLLVNQWGTQQAEGLLHLFEGWVIFIACAALLSGEIYLFASISGKNFLAVFHAPYVTTKATPAPMPARAWLPMGASILLLLVAGLGLSFISGRNEIVPERTRFVEFPSQLGFWHGHTSTLDPDVEHVLAVNDYILSDYTGPDGKAVNLYVAYYPSQRQGESPHSPIVCIPGGGWQIGQFQRTRTGPQDPQQFPFNRVVIARDGHQQVVYYWFDERGRKIANEWWSKWYLLTDAILKDRTDGALVRLTTPVFPGESDRDADARLHAFMGLVVPALNSYLPADPAETTRSALYQR